VLVDAYHAFNTLDFNADQWPGRVFVTGGGYKYAQSGEGVCWMLLPANSTERPRNTGWFAHFESLDRPPGQRVEYGAGGDRFFGATFDPTSLYRGLWVLRWMDELGLDVATLRAQSTLQTALIFERFDALNLAARGLSVRTPRGPGRGAFVALETPRARELVKQLRDEGVHTDARGALLRLGPAPYLTAAEIERGMNALARVLS
jgi:kynureninase